VEGGGMNKARDWWQVHRKAIIAAAGALITLGIAVFPSDSTIGKYVAAAAAVLTVAGVYRVPNAPGRGNRPSTPPKS
jgi:hypothetical protein